MIIKHIIFMINKTLIIYNRIFIIYPLINLIYIKSFNPAPILYNVGPLIFLFNIDLSYISNGLSRAYPLLIISFIILVIITLRKLFISLSYLRSKESFLLLVILIASLSL